MRWLRDGELSQPRRPGAWYATLLITLAAQILLQPNATFFSVNFALYLAPFFLAGLDANRFREFVQATPATYAAAAVFIGAIIPSWITILLGYAGPERQTPWGTTISLSGCLTLLVQSVSNTLNATRTPAPRCSTIRH